jgi:hypothetical protein
MITVLLIVLGIAVVAGIAWWIAQPRLGGHDAPPDSRLPLFSARATDGLRPPEQHPISAEPPPEVAMLRRVRTDAVTPPRQRVVGPADAAAGPPPAGAPPARANGTNGNSAAGIDTRAPTAPQPAIPADATRPGSADASRLPPRAAGTSSLQGSPALGAAAAAALPASGTMQFLPGRLEVLQGRGVAEQEVRFVRPVNKAQAAEITFGRGEGPPFTHVQLRAPTVSRLHARLVQQAAGGWALENLSATNPVILNGEEIPVGTPPRPLHDGDRLEMGEVVFRYHAR